MHALHCTLCVDTLVEWLGNGGAVGWEVLQVYVAPLVFVIMCHAVTQEQADFLPLAPHVIVEAL